MRAAAGIAALAAALACATGAEAAAAPTLAVAALPGHPGQLSLVAHLPGAAGRSIAFFVVSTEFKQPRDVPIGTAETAAGGTARIVYRPTWSGEERFVARLATPGVHAAQATAVYRVTASAPGPLYAGANPGRPLASVGQLFLDVILGLVALVWLSLGVTLAIAIGWLPRLARESVE